MPGFHTSGVRPFGRRETRYSFNWGGDVTNPGSGVFAPYLEKVADIFGGVVGGGGAVAGTPWTPELVTNHVWLDFGDPDVVTPISGTDLSFIADKGTDGQNWVAPFASYRPTIVDDSENLGGVDSIQFPGVQDSINPTAAFSQADWAFMHRSEGCSIYFTIYPQQDLSNDNSGMILQTNNTASPFSYGISIYYNLSGQSITCLVTRNNATYTSSLTSDIAIPNNTAAVVGIILDNDNPTPADRVIMTINGQVVGNSNTFNGAPADSDNPGSVPRIGTANNANTNEFAGEIGEVIIRRGQDSEYIRQRTEGYLAWRRGTEGSLPNNHPYKDAAPVQPATVYIPQEWHLLAKNDVDFWEEINAYGPSHIRRWKDQSGNGLNVQNEWYWNASLSTSDSGLPAAQTSVSFNGSDQSMLSQSTDPADWAWMNSGDPWTLFMLYYHRGDAQYDRILATVGAPSQHGFQMYIDGSSPFWNTLVARTYENGAVTSSGTIEMTYNAWNLLTIRFDPNNSVAADRIKLQVNTGTVSANNTDTGTLTGQTPSSTLAMMRFPGTSKTGTNARGNIAEILAVQGLVGDTEDEVNTRQAIEGWMSWYHAGDGRFLSADHPYKNEARIVDPLSVYEIPAHTPVSDPDAEAWLVNVEAADGNGIEQAVADAYNTFVTDLKSDGIWATLPVIVPMRGPRTLAGALTPLKGPAPTNNGFVEGDWDRMSLNGDASSYLDTNYANDNEGNISFFQAVYVRANCTQPHSGNAYMGRGTPQAGAVRMRVRNDQIFTDSAFVANQNSEGNTNQLPNPESTLILNRTLSNNFQSRANGNNVNTGGFITGSNLLSGNVYVFTSNGDSAGPTDAQLSLYARGPGLAAPWTFETRVNTLMAALDAALNP